MDYAITSANYRELLTFYKLDGPRIAMPVRAYLA